MFPVQHAMETTQLRRACCKMLRMLLCIEKHIETHSETHKFHSFHLRDGEMLHATTATKGNSSPPKTSQRLIRGADFVLTHEREADMGIGSCYKLVT